MRRFPPTSRRRRRQHARGPYPPLPFVLLLFIALVSTAQTASAYHRTPCNRRVRSNFQYPDCYVPPLDTSLLLSSASFLMSHDAATGYVQLGSVGPKNQALSLYGKTQVGTAYQQLNDGARALDLRPKLWSNGTVTMQHGTMFDLPFVTLDRIVSDAVRWCADNPTELVLLFPNNLVYEMRPSENDGGASYVSSMSVVFNKYDVPYVHCDDVAGLTVGEAMELAALPTGGYLMVVDRQDFYGSFCGKSNWVADKLVTCYGQQGNGAAANNATLVAGGGCTHRRSKRHEALREYVLSSANGDATDDSNSLGPPADTDAYPFYQIQALWQVDAASVVVGMSRGSSLIGDNRQSKVNADMVGLIHSEAFNGINLFAVDHVALRGNALLSVLRTRCGQSAYVEDGLCGRDVALPSMTHSRVGFWCLVAAYLSVVVWVAVRVWRAKHVPRSSAAPKNEGERMLSELANAVLD